MEPIAAANRTGASCGKGGRISKVPGIGRPFRYYQSIEEEIKQAYRGSLMADTGQYSY